MDPNKQRVAVLGAGTMARGMIKNLQKNGYELRLYNRTGERLQGLARDVDHICFTPAEAAQDADIILACVTDDEASEQIWLGPRGALQSAKRGAVAIENSTLSVPYIERWSRAMAQAGLKPLDCPISGSKTGAEEGTLSLFAGGEEATLDEVRPVLMAFASKIFHFGPLGTGIRFKLIHNLLGGSILVLIAEVLSLAQAFGMDVGKTAKALEATNWATRPLIGKADNMIADDHSDISCLLSIISKDLTYGVASAEQLRQEVPTARSAARLIQEAVNLGYGNLDCSSVSKLFLIGNRT